MNPQCIFTVPLLLCCAMCAGCIEHSAHVWRRGGSTAGDEKRMIQETSLSFPEAAQLQFHLVDAPEVYEEWLILCPNGTHPLKGHHVQTRIKTSLDLIATILETNDIGKPLSNCADVYGWDTEYAWRATVVGTDRGDYVLVERTRGEMGEMGISPKSADSLSPISGN